MHSTTLQQRTSLSEEMLISDMLRKLSELARRLWRFLEMRFGCKLAKIVSNLSLFQQCGIFLLFWRRRPLTGLLYLGFFDPKLFGL